VVVSRNLKSVLVLACTAVAVLLLLRLCSRIDRADAANYQIRRIGGAAHNYVFAGYETGAFQNLAVSNIPSLSALKLHVDENLREGIKRHLTDCSVNPVTGEKYVFSPVTPAGEVLYFMEQHPEWKELVGMQDTESEYFWMWNRLQDDELSDCILLNGRCDQMTSDEVSWYYQTRLSDLSPGQLTNEIQYRASKGLPPLSDAAMSNIRISTATPITN
jgi:hypothetical protein